MSDQPTDIVFSALQQMQANGVRARASLDTCERLRGTASAMQQKPNVLSRDAAPVAAKIAPEQNRRPLSSAAQPATPAASESARPQTAPAFSTRESSTGTGEKAAKLAALRGPVLACTKCANLVQSRTQVVFGVGNPDAEVMFVGEAPGADEDLVGEPFVGKAGQLLTKIIEAMNFRRADVYIANILKCRPNMPPGESGNRKPTPAEMNVCKPYLIQQIEIIQPKILVALGATAVEGLLGMEKAGITRLRGTWKEFHGIPLMPTFHPSFLLRPTSEQMANKRLVWEDMLAVLEHLGHEITAKQRGYFLTK
jgi:DNA polymerase